MRLSRVRALGARHDLRLRLLSTAPARSGVRGPWCVPAALRAWEAERRPGTDVARTAARRARGTASLPWVARVLRGAPRA